MTDPLPPLGLDDLRVAEPDRDSEAAFSPSETWWRACDAIVAGHKVADVAALLLELPSGDLVQLRDWWADVCLSDHERDATCPDLLLCGAIINAGWDWFLPSVDAATVLPLLDERDRLQAAIRAALPIAATFANPLSNYPEVRASAERMEATLRAALS